MNGFTLKSTLKSACSALAAVASAVPSRPATPVLGGVLVDASADGVRATGFDYEVGIRASIPAEDVDGVGTIVVPYRALRRTLVGLRGVSDTTAKTLVTLDAKSRPGFLLVAAHGWTVPISLLPLSEWPTAGRITPVPQVGATALGVDMVSTLRFVRSCMSADEIFPILNGTRITLAPGEGIDVDATDRVRLGHARCKADVAREATAVVGRLLLAAWSSLTSGAWDITVADSQVSVTDDQGTTVTGVAIDGEFPRGVKDLFPLPDGRVVVTVNRMMLLRAARFVVGLVASEPGVLGVRSDGVTFVPRDCDGQEVSAPVIPGEVSGSLGHGAVVMNPVYLARMLGEFTSREVSISLDPVSPYRPVLVAGCPGDLGDPAARRQLVMPIRLLPH